jgi:hypothetical protein
MSNVRTRVAMSDWWASRKVVSVTRRRLLVVGPAREPLGAQFQQTLAGAGRGSAMIVRRHDRGGQGFVRPVALGVRVPVHDDVAEEVEQLRGAIAPRLEGEELRGGVDQGRRSLPGAERRVGDDVFEERNVGLDAADAEFGQGARERANAMS